MSITLIQKKTDNFKELSVLQSTKKYYFKVFKDSVA